MRILYSHRIQSRDGQSVHIDELVAAFRKAGHEVLVIGPSLYDNTEFGGESRIVLLVRRILPNWLAELAEILYNFLTLWRLRRAQRHFAPDFVYERYNLYHLAGALLAKWYHTKLYLEVNSPLAEERAHFGGLRFRRLARCFERFTWRSAEGIFVVSAVLKEIVAAAGIPKERIAVVPNGVDRETYRGEPRAAHTDSLLTIGFIGFIRDWHGLGEVIAGLGAETSNAAIRLVIVGDGPARLSLEKQAAELGITSQVLFVGVQQRQEVAELVRSFNIAIQPQAVRYASPLKLFEYMACARAIVAPDQPNIQEILDHGETALLFNPNEPGAMWRAICHLANQPDLRERLGNAARRILDERDYTWQGNVAKIIAAVEGGSQSYGTFASCGFVHDPVVPHESQ